MPNLRPGERMQRCETGFHAEIRKQKYYICRKYYNELEQHFCAGCLNALEHLGIVEYSIGDGYTPRGDLTIPAVLDTYTKKPEVSHGR